MLLKQHIGLFLLYFLYIFNLLFRFYCCDSLSITLYFYFILISSKSGNIHFFAVIPPEHPLTHREMITQEDLKYERLIIHNFSRSKSEFPHDFPAGYLRNDLMQNISRTNDDAATIQTMVAAGMGIGILTELEVEKAPMPLNLSYIPLETDGIQEILYVIYSRKNENPLIPLFLEEMKK